MKTRTIPRANQTRAQRLRKPFTAFILVLAVALGGPSLMGSSFIHDMANNVKTMVKGDFFDAPGVAVETRQEPASSTAEGYDNLTRINQKPTEGRKRLYYHSK